MSSDLSESDARQALIDEVLRGRSLSADQVEAVRVAVEWVLARHASGQERTQLLTIPYETSADSTLAPLTDGELESTGGSHEVPSSDAPETDLMAVGLLGHGGMGEVHRARDNTLERHLAMKLLHARLASDARMRARFLAEATVTAQLAHPGIPPVHQLGESRNGRPFFTMKEVHGKTLGDVIREFHRPGLGAGWSESKLLDVFLRVCEAVAYAHSRGVIHCDLKPANVMVGAFGEVLVMDWGVARIVEPSHTRTPSQPPVTHQWEGAAEGDATVAGTPAYMPPEQAAGDHPRMGPHTDVFALGVILYEILAGTRPFQGGVMRMIRAITMGAIPPIPRRSGSLIDDELVRIIHTALAGDPAHRFSDAGALADEFGRWKEGSLKREAALKVVRQAERMLPDIEPRLERARSLRELAERQLASLEGRATAQEKASAWGLLDEAEGLELEATMRTTEVIQLLQGALMHAPNLPEARRLLARIHFESHQQSVRKRQRTAIERQEMLLREHDVGDYAAYLAGTAALSLQTEPSCEVLLHVFAEENRRLVAREVHSLGRTPLVEVELPIGSYLLELRADDRPPVMYPIQLNRLENWTAAAPGRLSAAPLRLPAAGEIGADEVFVPAGWARLGGDPDAPGSAREARVWVPSFAMRRHPVTAREMYGYLASQDDREARSELLRATNGLWHPDWPAVGASWYSACRYAAWVAETTGQGWRLPSEAEWEKAARGVDGRLFPWGDFGDEAFCHARSGQSLPSMPLPVGAVLLDASPYGVLGMAGNAREWCLDVWRAGALDSVTGRSFSMPTIESDEPKRSVRGGSWKQPLELARSAARSGMPASEGHGDVAFRLMREV